MLSVDNGPELISEVVDEWAYRRGVRIAFNRPGTPTDNAFGASFNGHFREECLDRHGFASIEKARPMIEAWRVDDNPERPQRALGQRTPAAASEVSATPLTASGLPSRWTRNWVQVMKPDQSQCCIVSDRRVSWVSSHTGRLSPAGFGRDYPIERDEIESW